MIQRHVHRACDRARERTAGAWETACDSRHWLIAYVWRQIRFRVPLKIQLMLVYWGCPSEFWTINSQNSRPISKLTKLILRDERAFEVKWMNDDWSIKIVKWMSDTDVISMYLQTLCAIQPLPDFWRRKIEYSLLNLIAWQNVFFDIGHQCPFQCLFVFCYMDTLCN